MLRVSCTALAVAAVAGVGFVGPPAASDAAPATTPISAVVVDSVAIVVARDGSFVAPAGTARTRVTRQWLEDTLVVTVVPQ